jgi:hypothetical protein
MADTYLSAPRSACPLWVGTGLSRALLDFNLAICYAGMKGRVRPRADIRVRHSRQPARGSGARELTH